MNELLHGLDKLTSWIEQRGWANRNIAFVSLALSVLSLLTACPDYRHFGPYPASSWAAEAVAWKFKYPFERIPVTAFAAGAGAGEAGVIEQLEKRSYRIAVPAAANILGFSVRGMLLAEQAGAVAFLGIFVLLASEALADATSALFAGVMAATSFIGQWCFNDFTNFDGVAYLVLALLLWTRSAVCVSGLIIFGAFCDERVILAAPLVWLWHAQRPARGGSHQPLVEKVTQGPGAPESHSLNGGPVCWGLLIGLIGFGLLRLVLGCAWGQMADTSGMAMGVVKSNLLWLPLALFGGAKGGLLIVLAAGLLLVSHGCLRELALIGFACAPCLLAALWVYDLTRSLAFGFPCYFIAMGILRRHTSASELRELLFCAALGCALLPTYWVLLRVYYLLPVVRWL